MILSGCEDKKETAAAEPVRPLISQVVAPRAATTLRLAGVVEPRVSTDLGFRVLGRVIAREVSVGDLVTRGQVVAAVDPLALELAVRSSQAEIANAQAQLANAATTAARQRTLAESKSDSEASLETAEQAEKTARATVAKAEANLAKAREQLSYAQIHAEFDGVVTATSAEVGQVVSPGQTVLTIARPDLRDAVVDLPETAMRGLKIGSPFEVMLQLDASVRVSGTVREIAPEADSTTRTQRVKIALNNPPDAFRLGSIVTVSSTTDASPTIVVPMSAILTRDGASAVWLVDEDKETVSLKPVTLAQADGDGVVVSQGLAAGNRIALAGVHQLKEGQKVKITREMAP
nr:efflux RND transporter periplasmic adaptor subunit [Xaviernesmea oryzae]